MENTIFLCYIFVISHSESKHKLKRNKWSHWQYDCKVMTFDLQQYWHVLGNYVKSSDE